MASNINLRSTVNVMGRFVTQIIHFNGGNKRNIRGIDTESIKQGEFTKMKLRDGRLIMINTANVDMVEVFAEK